MGARPKKINILNRVKFSFTEKKKKKGIVSQVLLSKLLYIGQIYTISKFIKEKIEKTIRQLSIWTSYFTHRYSTKFSRIPIDLKIIKPQQCFRQRSHAVMIELKE